MYVESAYPPKNTIYYMTMQALWPQRGEGFAELDDKVRTGRQVCFYILFSNEK